MQHQEVSVVHISQEGVLLSDGRFIEKRFRALSNPQLGIVAFSAFLLTWCFFYFLHQDMFIPTIASGIASICLTVMAIDQWTILPEYTENT